MAVGIGCGLAAFISVPVAAEALPANVLMTLGGLSVAQSEVDDTPISVEPKKRRRKKRRRTRRRKRVRTRTSPPPARPIEASTAPPQQRENTRAAQDRTKRVLEGRSKSRVTQGTASRWSNRGAMVPIVSDVPITQPLPQRAVPRAAGVPTVGQRLQGQEELLFARASVGFYHLETIGQNQPALDVMRARATVSYQRIADTKLGLQVDAEFRPQLSGRPQNRPTDYRINELYLSWGRTDWRRRRTGPSWGVALGRVAIREAGFAQADGIAARFRIVPELMVGAWGGVTSNPYGYEWRQVQEREDENGEVQVRPTPQISADWYTGGAFASLLWNRFTFNIAGGTTIANSAVAQGTDRVFVFVDSSVSITRGLNLLLNGWFDVLPDGQVIQNVDLLAAYRPTSNLSFSIAGGRFSTVLFVNTEDQSFIADPNGNRAGVQNAEDRVIVGIDGAPALTFDSAQLAAVYNSIRVRAGYRLIPEIEAFVRWNTLLRDTSITNNRVEGIGATTEFATVRSLPTLGLRYRNPKILNASAAVTYIIDEEATATTIVRGRLGRSWRGLSATAGGRVFFGEIGGFDAGVDLGFALPRSWTPGALTFRGSFRYFQENIAVIVPTPLENAPDNTTVLPNQESFYGYAGVDWRY